MNDRTENRIREIRRRTKQKRRRIENQILSVLTAVSIFLTVNIYELLADVKKPGVAYVVGKSSTVLLKSGTSTHVVVAIAAFCLGVCVTVICIKWQNRIKEKKKHTDE